MPPVGGDNEEHSGDGYQEPCHDHPEAAASERPVRPLLQSPSERSPDPGDHKEKEGELGNPYAGGVRDREEDAHADDPIVRRLQGL